MNLNGTLMTLQNGIALLVTLLVLVPACETEKPEKKEPKTWVFESEKAPYTVELPSDWRTEDPAALNKYADLAITKADDRLFLIVIPQALPDVEGVQSPDALALKRASLDIMKNQIDDLKIVRQGPVRLDGELGQTVVASGSSDGDAVYYITTYLTRGSWAYQIVGWGPTKKKRRLVAAVDGILNGWNFTNDSKRKPKRDIKSSGDDSPDQ